MTRVPNIFKNTKKKCRLLLIMSYLTIGLLVFLNIYIGFCAFPYFIGDGWSFMGGLIISMSYIVTIPALIFSILSIRMIRNENNNKYFFSLVIGVIGVLVGFILYNAIDWWIFIVLFNMLLVISCLICGKKQKSIDNNAEVIFSTKNKKSSLPAIKKDSIKNSTYKIVVFFQIIGLVLLFILAISSFFTFSSEYNTSSPQLSSILKLIFIFLFLLHGVVTIAFFKKKKWALNFKYIESYILLAITVLIFVSALITEGFSLTNTFLFIVISFTIFILLFIYLIHNYKKLKTTKIFLVLLIALFSSCFFIPSSLMSQENSGMQEVSLLDKNDLNPYVEFYSTDITDYYTPENSSKYPSTNLFDGYLKTCWVAGSAKNNSSNILYVKVPNEIPLDKLMLNIFSGYGKSKKLYYANARPKKIKISILSAYNLINYSTEVAERYIVKKYPIKREIVLADTFGVQSFPLNINEKDLLNFQSTNIKNCRLFLKNNKIRPLENDSAKIGLSFILKFEIADVYKGSKYDDICISEIFFNNRFVTPYPDRYNQINNVYVQNDNILMVDYADKKGVIIYRDTTSTLSVLGWEDHSNWVILSYVKNDEVGQNSRIEESYLLIDLKNRKVVNEEFKKCTGISVYSPIIEKKENGEIFLNTFDIYKVELK